MTRQTLLFWTCGYLASCPDVNARSGEKKAI